jgi:hypothetical protein
MLPGCNGGETAVDTEFERMLEYVPYSFLENYDIYYGNMGQSKELYGVKDVDSFEAFQQLTEEQQSEFTAAWVIPAGATPRWTFNGDLSSLAGFDGFSFDRTIKINNIPPRISCVAQGEFDEELIVSKLTEQGYTKTAYGNYAYYGIRDDFDFNLRHPISQIALADMNRVAVFDNTLIISPDTEDVTSIFDTMDGGTPSIIDNAVGRALADSLGDVLAATFTTPARVIYYDPSDEEDRPLFYFTIPVDWGTLRGYEMAALGYRVKGDEHYFDIALYYTDKQAAEADGEEIVKRMQSYLIGTWLSGFEPCAFTDWWQPDEPVVTQYGDGAVLKISCHAASELPRWISEFLGVPSFPYRDLLFLAVDPSPYIGQNE